MPYITQEAKTSIHHWRDPRGAENPGELNYLLTCQILSYWRGSPKNYQAINDIIGALEGCKAEFQRRVVNVYEDRKLQANGDVYRDEDIR